MTGKDIFDNICQSVTDLNLPWCKVVGLATDGEPVMYSGKSRLVERMQLKKQVECTGDLIAYPLHHTLSTTVEHVMSTVTQTVDFIRAKGLNHYQFQSFYIGDVAKPEKNSQWSFPADQGNLSVH